MKETSLRLTELSEPPTLQQIESWMGRKAYGSWARVSKMIAQSYRINLTRISRVTF